MSPTKPRPAAAVSRVLTRAASSIPRRAAAAAAGAATAKTTKTTTTKTRKTTSTASSKTALKPKAPTTRRKQQDSVLSNPSNAEESTNIFANAASTNALSDDKENMGIGSTRVLRSRVRPVSPTKGKTGICKPTPTCSKTRTRSSRRVPLRELTDHEIFERDAATLGDLRRRRSGEHSGTYIEFDTHHAPEAEASSESMETRDSSAVASNATEEIQPTAVTEPETHVGRAKEKIQVLRRTSSVESLKRKVDAIVAATATANNTKATTKKRTGSALRNKVSSTPQHPAVRNASPSVEIPDILANSPILAPRAASPITKPAPVRTGLGTKNVNTLLKEATKAAAKHDAAGTKKPVVAASNAPATKNASRKPAFNSLRRAAGSSIRLRPTPSTAVNSARTGLDAIRRMR